MRSIPTVVLLALAPIQAPAMAAPLDGLSGLGSALLPSMSSVGAGNAAGLLSYCIKRKLVSGATAQSVLGKLTGKPEIANSKSFLAGRNGQISTRSGQFSLDGLKDSVKGKLCSMVLDRASGFAP